jgi:peptidylprolyl isomerase
MFRKWTFIIGSLAIMTTFGAHGASAADAENTLYMDLPQGRVTIEMLPDRAPSHVDRIKKLTREGFYNGVIFHRVIDGFMAQTGDPTGTGTGGSKYADLNAEFTDYPYKRGTVGMARTNDPNSANSQFFICFTDDGCSFLTGHYTVWGQVTSGMEYIDALPQGEPPANPGKIVKMTVAADEATATPVSAPESAPAPDAAETAKNAQ